MITNVSFDSIAPFLVIWLTLRLRALDDTEGRRVSCLGFAAPEFRLRALAL